MLKEKNVTSYNDYLDIIKRLERKKTNEKVVFEFKSSDENGKSWDKNCQQLDKQINDLKVSSNIQLHGILFRIHVGSKAAWSDPQNPYKSDKTMPIKVIPTLVVWGSKQRHEGERALEDANLTSVFI